MPASPCPICDVCSRAAGHPGRCRCPHPCDIVQGFCYHHRVYQAGHPLAGRDACPAR